MTISRVQEGDVSIFQLTGRLETTTTVFLDREFTEAFNAGERKFVWDCSQLTYISSAGLRTVLQALKRLNNHEGRLIIAAPSTHVLEVFEISGFKELLALSPDRTAALHMFK
jgi:stage II sporulation protein AA (anti-sigma F factor antagonist)